MQLLGWMTAILMAMICVAGMFLITAELQANYHIVEVNTVYGSTFNKINETLAITEEMADAINAIDPDEGLAEFAIDLFNAGWKGVIAPFKLAFGTIDVLHTMFVEMGRTMGIPSIFTDVFLGILIITIFFMIASYLGKWKLNE